MCTGPVGKGQSYWGLIQIKVPDNGISESQLDDFKVQLQKFLSGQSVSSPLPQNVTATLANGTIKTDDQGDHTSIQLKNRSA